ncbi:unnamed protein product [Brugia pahangi]|uniref:Cadherin domain-containing protein n=1 Tax=Brugia pahangi TaxID=6280 RepID=A0A0N4TH50_BRUPA|nr:unnamed protein product [Brugia pahangi]
MIKLEKFVKQVDSARLRITVKDTNDHVPVFSRPWYTFNISEGKIYSELARLQATDKDCGHPYGQICRYQITNALDGFPFAIDDQVGLAWLSFPFDINDKVGLAFPLISMIRLA